MLTGLASLTHFWTFGVPPKSSQKAIRWANNALLRPQIVLNLAFWPMKRPLTAHIYQIWSRMLHLGGHHK